MKRLTLSLLFSLLILHSFAQEGCPANIDFEDGDLTHWDCFTGSTYVTAGKNVIALTPTTPTAGYHELITDPDAKDPYGKFPQLCPYGGKYSIKLGNNSSGGQAEGMSYTFNVPATVDTFTFTYFYAVVFQDPGHDPTEQPRFFVTAYDVLTGDLINCASYDYIATSTLPGFKKSSTASDVLYKDWSPVSIQFAGLANRSVRLEFKTADCTLGGHFGYAYLDVGTGCSNILATAPYCIETNSLILNAPYGFQSYTWYSGSDYKTIIGNEQAITLSPPPTKEGRFFVDLVPYPGFGCRDTAYADVTPLPVPEMPEGPTVVGYCQFASAEPLEAVRRPGGDLLWYTSATGGVASINPLIPGTFSAGVQEYFVTQKVLFGCESFRKKISVITSPTPAASFTINNNRQCQVDNEFVFTSTSTNLSNSIYIWDFGDGRKDTTSNTITRHTFTNYGNPGVKLKVLNQPSCAAEASLPVRVIPKPIADFSYPPVICEAQTPLVFRNNSSIPASLSTINKWRWEVDGVVSFSQTPAPFIPSRGGPLPVQLVVESPEGCISDPAVKTPFVHYRPAADFSYAERLCENEITFFTDLSSLPAAAASENVVKWSWQFGSTQQSALRNPAQSLQAGVHTASLKVETNYGCQSTETVKSFTVRPKPHVLLDINDSCVYRTIRYSTTDLDNSVVKWNWDFGNGFREGKPVIVKMYQKEGPMPLVLISQNEFACYDTINRPFRIYDNKAFAGKDTIVAVNEPVYLDARGGAALTYVWTPSEGLDNAGKEKPVATLDKDMLYRLDALTPEGCDSHSQIFIKRYKGPELYIPNAFTPNNDGVNDKLKVFPVGIRKFGNLAIYSRSGELLFRTTDYSKGWDGVYKGKQMPVGNYVAVAVAEDYKGRAMLKKENVVLIR